MAKLDWRTMELNQGVFREPTPDDSRIILWISGKEEDGFRNWERITNVPGAKIVEEQGIFFTEATSLPARQKLSGMLGKLLNVFRKPGVGNTWLLPTGGFAEQAGERLTGMMLIWPAPETANCDEAKLQKRWRTDWLLRKIGTKLFAAMPAQQGFVNTDVVADVLGNPRDGAEKLLKTARGCGDRRAQALALTDLGIACTPNETRQAITLLEEAVAIESQWGDLSGENDALSHLGMALGASGEKDRALELLIKAATYAKEVNDRFLEKNTLANQAIILAGMRKYEAALDASQQALALARDIGDRNHEAELLWFQGVQHAELGRRERAASLAQAAIDVHAALRSPHVRWLANHLKQFRPIILRAKSIGPPPGGYYTGPTAPTQELESESPCNAGWLKTAMSAVRTMEKSAQSGMKTVAPPIYQQRLETCATCPHHTGARCKVCGSFTSTKAWLPHEKCPLDKWSD